MSEANVSKRILLPTHVKPSLYKVHIAPEIEASTFSGSVAIDMQVVQAVQKNTITLHSLELTIDKSHITLIRHGPTESASSQQVTTDTFEVNQEEETVTFEFGGEPFKVGEKLTLKLAFSGSISDAISGLYHSNCTVNGVTKKGISTQFESVDARRCFPCFDEPALKARFLVSMTIDKHYTALSNMPVKSEEKAVGESKTKKTLHFEESPLMSTYLICMVVGEYESIEAKTETGVVVRVWTQFGEKERGAFALDVGVRALDFYHKFFGIAYPLPKLDMVALANMGGAMENWGLVTYRDNALLCDPSKASLRQRITILTIVTHELGHQWFGNLCTMEWWKELWLNEGFASWAETYCADVLYPQYKVWTDFCRMTLSDGLALDSLLTSHPIEVEVYKSRDVDEIFDSISYNKGAGVIRMLASYIGMKAFSKGLHAYLLKHSYKNATTLDLWEALSQEAKIDIKAMMQPWTANQGYPVIYIDCNKDGKVLHFRQERFLASGKPKDEDNKVIWPIRLTIQTKSLDTTKDQSKTSLPQGDSKSLVSGVSYVEFDSKEKTIDYDTFNLTWLKANVNHVGFFRIVYHDDLFQKLLHGIKAGDFEASDRWGLLNDAFATCLAGLTGINDLFSLLELFKGETDNTVLGEIAANLAELEIVFGDKFSEQIKKFKRSLFAPSAERLGWDTRENETDHETASRPIVLQAMAETGDQAIIAKCRELFGEMGCKGYQAVSPTLWGLVLNTVARNASKAEVEKLKSLTTSLTDSMAVNQTIRCLGHIGDRELLKETLVWTFLNENIVTSNVPRVVFGASEHQTGREVAFEVFTEHMEPIQKRLHRGPFLFSMTIEHVTVFASEEYATRVKDLFSSAKIVGIDRTVEQCIDKIHGRAVIAKRSSDALAKWFTSHGY